MSTVSRLDTHRISTPVIAVDVFDTIVERTVAPEHVKLLACDRLRRSAGIDLGAAGLYNLRARLERELSQERERTIGELEFAFDELVPALRSALGSAVPEHLTTATWTKLVEAAELGAEGRVLRPCEGMLERLAAFRGAGRRIVLLTDMYLPARLLRPLLRGCGLPDEHYEALLVSSEVGASKRTGRLYRRLLDELGLDGDDITMIGDNPHSDDASARAHGLAVAPVHARQADFYRTPAARVDDVPAVRETTERVMGAGPALGSARELVPGLLEFTERLYADARAAGVPTVHFLAREGFVLRRLFEALQDALDVPDVARVRTAYLPVSRRAVYCAGLDLSAPEPFAQLFAQYRAMSLRDFFASLSLSTTDADEVAARLGLDAGHVWPDFPRSDALARLLDDETWLAALTAHVAERRAQLVRLLEGVEWLVDCGWKGSMQGFLERAIGRDLEGRYVGLLDVGQDTARKQGLLFSNVGGGRTPGFWVFDECRSAYEIVLGADHGSVLGYRDDDDGLPVPIHDDTPDPAAEQARVLTADLVATAHELLETRARTAIDDADRQLLAIEAHAGLVLRPWRARADWLRTARHRENFGVYGWSTIVPECAEPRRARELVRHLRHPQALIEGSHWPAATLHALGGRTAVWLYRAYRRRTTRRLARALGGAR